MDLAEIVELEDDSSVYGIELSDDVEIETVVIDKLSPIWTRLFNIIPGKVDQEIVKLMMDGVRETDAFAEVLGIPDLPYEQKFRIVKQNKDRLKKVIQRHIQVTDLKNE